MTTYHGNSSNRKTVAHGGAVVPHPFGISLFEHNVYFTDWTKMAVIKANKFIDNQPQVIYTTSQTPHGVAVIHQLKQPQGTPIIESSLLSVESYRFNSCLFYIFFINTMEIYMQFVSARAFKEDNLTVNVFSRNLDCFLVSPVPNPCSVDRGGCEQICVLSHRSDNGGLGYRCKCRLGYDLHADGKRCMGK